jgi:predicted metal-dependent HD superfamily phosphohydrolase
MSSFKSEFLNVLSGFQTDVETCELAWDEIKRVYSHPKRYYHNLNHLEHMFQMLLPLKNQFSNWEAVIFAIAYHDFVYNVVKSDNEEQSALYAEKRLKEIRGQQELIDNCLEHILATKKHLPARSEINLFTDADLSILGAKSEVYREYAENIRKEYSVFPSLIYKPGRKKVVAHFLAMDRIFKTHEFYEKCEMQARENLENELLGLK